MPSVSSNPVRRPPQQQRSERRLAGVLEVASDLIVEVGYEAATMTEIAERSGTSIGGLYHYFPDKKSIALSLLSLPSEGRHLSRDQATSLPPPPCQLPERMLPR